MIVRLIDLSSNLKDFILFIEFYPYIKFNSDLLLKAIDFASNYVCITEQDKKSVLHTKESLLYNNKTSGANEEIPCSTSPWVVMMGLKHVNFRKKKKKTTP